MLTVLVAVNAFPEVVEVTRAIFLVVVIRTISEHTTDIGYEFATFRTGRGFEACTLPSLFSFPFEFETATSDESGRVDWTGDTYGIDTVDWSVCY